MQSVGKNETAYHYKGLLSAVRHISGEVMIWSFLQPKDHLTVIWVDHKCFCVLFKYRVRYEDSWLAEIGSCKRTIFTNLPANLQQRNKKRINNIVRSSSYNIWGNYFCDLGLYKQNPDELKQCYKEAWTQISMMWHTKNIKKLLKVVLQQWSQTRGPGDSCGPRHPYLWPVHWREEI